MRTTIRRLAAAMTAAAAICGGLLLAAPPALAHTGTIDAASKYAWAEKAGWLNFFPPTGSVSVTDTKLTGYVWSDNFGWIRLDPTQGGVTNTCKGVLGGMAWGENAGWIDFTGATIDSSGNFKGTAAGNTIIGRIAMSGTNFALKTTWRYCSTGGGGGGGGGGTWTPPAVPPVPPAGGFKVVANNGASTTTGRYVTLTLTYGTDTTKVLVSSFADFHDTVSVVPVAVSPGMTWDLCYDYTRLTQLATCDNGLKGIYVKFYSSTNGASAPVSTSITLNATGVQPTPPATPLSPAGGPPSGSIYVSSPSQLIGHTESELWRDPLTGAIWLLPGGWLTPLPPTAPAAPAPAPGELTPEQITEAIKTQCPASVAAQLLACPVYLTKYIKLGAANDPAEVKKLQQFLITYEGFKSLTASGVYGQADFEAVKIFQTRYGSDILAPIGLINPTGYVAGMTVKKVNALYCLYTEKDRLAAAQEKVKTQCVIAPPTPAPAVCTDYLTSYIWPNRPNDAVAVRKLQQFLSTYEGFVLLRTTGIYGEDSEMAVEEFQEKYYKDVLGPWSIPREGTGNVYINTRKKINELYCSYSTGKLAPVPAGMGGHRQLEPAGEAPVCPALLTKTVAAGLKTDAAEVKKLQQFLVTVMGYAEVKVSGVYDATTTDAVHAFQDTYPVGILPLDAVVIDGTGTVDEATMKKINEFNCRYAAGWRP